MKVLILAAGYGTRFTRDLESHKDEYPHLVGVAKPLLPVAGQPLISHWMDTLRSCDQTKDCEVYVVVNASNQDQFEKWSGAYSQQVKLVCDGSTCNEERIGAVGCIELAVRHFEVQDHLIVVGGDTLFLEDFKLADFVKDFLASRASSEGGALVPCYRCKDDETHKFGILEIDDSGLVTSFLEKPSPESTSSRMACPCFYVLSKGSLEILSQFLTEKKAAPLKERDAPGNFIKYLSSRRMVFAKEVSGRFDVGGLQSYLECCERYKPSKSLSAAWYFKVENSNDKDEAIERHGAEEKKKSRFRVVADEVFPQLSLYRGREKLSRRKSSLIVGLLYVSHSFSAWGDRMWGFVASLFLVNLYPGSLLLPAIFGFLVQLSTAAFGTLVGDWVDTNPRMRVVWMSLLIQNSLVALCSIVIALMFALEWDVCRHLILFACLTPLVIIFGSGANLASVANTISIEKDWVVVLADKNENTLAALNANMRRIDLLCKLLAPAIAGIFLQHAGAFSTTIIVAGWNVVSFFMELFLVWLVYRMIPTLAVKKLRKQSTIDMTGLIEGEEGEGSEDYAENEEISNEDYEEEEGDKEKGDTLDLHPLPKTDPGCPCTCCRGKKAPKIFAHLLTPFTTIINGWRIYMRQEIALIGFAMASIYLTVLGFSGVTAAYFVTQGLRNDIIGVCQGIGAVFGVTGTVIYPFIRRHFGTVRTGLFGIFTQWLILLLCIVAIAVPSNRISSNASGYYSADCSKYAPNPRNDSNVAVSMSVSIPVTQCIVIPTSVENLPFNRNLVTTTAYSRTLMPSSLMPLPSPSPSSNQRNPDELKRFVRNIITTSSLPPCPPEAPPITTTPTPDTLHSSISIALIFMLLGVICCRVGIWTFDLAVQQLVQEKVKEEERGVVGGVMNAMNSIMDMMHYVLVIAAPRPEHFSILTVISVGMITLGLILYMAYLRKVRGHIFHVKDCYHWTKRKIRGERGRGGSVLLFADENDPTSFVNEEVEGEEQEEERADLLGEDTAELLEQKQT